MFERTVSDFRGLNMSELEMDQAWLNISSSLESPIWLYTVSNDCRKCPFERVNGSVSSDYWYKSAVNVLHGVFLRLRTSGNATYASVDDDSDKICDIDGSHLGEFGVYSLRLEKEGDDLECILETYLEPVDIYSPIIAIFGFWLLVAYLSYSSIWHRKINSIWRKLLGQNVQFDCLPVHDKFTCAIDINDEIQSKNDEDDDDPIWRFGCIKRSKAQKKPETPVTFPTSSGKHVERSQVLGKERMQSLDVFRGLCVLIMIFANDGGGGYYFFKHATWNGLYVADLAFPWFLWICGVCIPLSIHSRIQNRYTKKATIFKGVLMRAIKLVGLGLIDGTVDKSKAVQLENLRFPGVLQRIGICYFVCSTLYLFYAADEVKAISNPLKQHQNNNVWSRGRQMIDVKVVNVPWMIVAALVMLHTLIIFFLPVPGCPTGYLGHAGLHDGNIYPAYCKGGATGYLDRLIIGKNHMHKEEFDPHGFLGVLTSILKTWLGVQAGIILILYKSRLTMLFLKFILWSLLCGFGGIALCGGPSNTGLIPLNQRLWSLSIVLVTSSGAFLVFATMYLVIDVMKGFSGSPLMEAGKNSIFLYIAQRLCRSMLPWNFSYGRMRTHSWRLLECSWGAVLWIVIAVHLHKRQLYFTV